MNHRLRVQVVVSAAAVVAVVVHQVWPGLLADPFSGTLLVVAVLPWLAPMLKTIKLPGGLEVELRELRDDLDQTRGEVRSVAIQAQVGAAVLDTPSWVASDTAKLNVSTESLRALGSEYERVRDSMPSGSTRTDAMTRMVAKMLTQAAALSDLDVKTWLGSQSRGDRLAAVAFVHAHPSADFVSALVDMLLDVEHTPFGQYWALRALHRVAEVDVTAFLPRHRDRLQRYKDAQRPGTDRQYEVTRLLRDLRDHARASRT